MGAALLALYLGAACGTDGPGPDDGAPGGTSAAGMSGGIGAGAGAAGTPSTVAGTAANAGSAGSGGAPGAAGTQASSAGTGAAPDAGGPDAPTDSGTPSLDAGDSGTVPELSDEQARMACQTLLSDQTVNWRESALKSDQQIVACLAGSLGQPVGYGEAARGGYDPAGGSQLTVITKGGSESVEQQLANAVAGDGHNWIVFDKADFADPSEVAMYRLHCDDSEVQAALGVDGPALCLDHRAWCGQHGVGEGACLATFFNDRLDDSDLPIRNVRIGSNKTLDGRHSQASLLFNGFAIGSDSGGEPVETSHSVIVTNLLFQGAGHTEDHGLDPDMLRATGASHDIWIHQNTFDLTGDAAFDVKVGAYDITISFNRVQDVKRASLHGSSDSREINEQIRTTLHHNAFVTSDALYDAFGNTGRRVPLIRRGKSHLFNNVFYGYRKDVLSVRVGARVAFEDNLFLANPAVIGDDDLAYFVDELLADFRAGGLSVTGSYVALASAAFVISGSPASLNATHGSTPDLFSEYSQASRDRISAHRGGADQALVDYVMRAAGKGGEAPFNTLP